MNPGHAAILWQHLKTGVTCFLPLLFFLRIIRFADNTAQRTGGDCVMYTGMTLSDYINLYMLIAYVVTVIIAVLQYIDDNDKKKK